MGYPVIVYFFSALSSWTVAVATASLGAVPDPRVDPGPATVVS